MAQHLGRELNELLDRGETTREVFAAFLRALEGTTKGNVVVFEDLHWADQATLDLEMLGEWAVKLRLGGPVRDQLILLYEFDEKGARPATRRDRLPRK